MKKRDIINLVKESVKEMRSFYGVHDTYGASPRQTRNLSGYPGVMEDEDLKEILTDDYIKRINSIVDHYFGGNEDIRKAAIEYASIKASGVMGGRSHMTSMLRDFHNQYGPKISNPAIEVYDMADDEAYFEGKMYQRDLNEDKKGSFMIGLKVVSRDEMLSYMYSNPNKPIDQGSDGGKWYQTNLVPETDRLVTWDTIKDDMIALEKKYGKGNVVVSGTTRGGDPVVDVYVNSVNENKENLKEFTDYGREGRYPKKEVKGNMFQQKEVEDLFPKGMASRGDQAFLDRVKAHAKWTEEQAFNTTFVHMQYHETKGLEDEYFIYQTQHYNGNYKDYRNPKFTLLSITKNKDTENEEDLGEYIVDTDAYKEDLEVLRSRGVLGDKVMELFGRKPKPSRLPIDKERLRKVFDAVNNSNRPEFFKNVFKGMYRIPFPENFEDITDEQALKMNMFMNDMKNKIREITGKLYTVKSTDGTEKQVPFANDAEAKAAVKYSNIKSVVPMEELDLTNDIGKDDYVDDEGRYAKSQLYKMAKYAVKLHQKLDDMEQLPAWLQSKITKASDYMSMVYHYLDYEMARRDGNLMQEMDRYKEEMLKELTEEPNEGNAFAVARLKAIKNLEKKKAKGEKIKPEDKEFTAPNGEKKPLTNVSDDDIKAAKEL